MYHHIQKSPNPNHQQICIIVPLGRLLAPNISNFSFSVGPYATSNSQSRELRASSLSGKRGKQWISHYTYMIIGVAKMNFINNKGRLHIRGQIQYLTRRLIVRSRKALNLEQLKNSNNLSRAFETLRDLAIRRLMRFNI